MFPIMIQKGARAMNLLETNGVAQAAMKAPEWQPFKWWTKATGEGLNRRPPRLLVSWAEGVGYKLSQEVFESLSTVKTYQQMVDVLETE